MRIHSLILIALFAFQSHAHIRAKTSGNLIPRSNSDSQKTAPCGGFARSAVPATYMPGQTITVAWDETINHPGRFEIYFSPANDTNWQLLKTIPDITDNNNTPHPYSTTVTLPSTPCAACTIQLIQVMEENPAAPTYYYSCSDIKIEPAGTIPPPPPPVSQPVVPVSDPCN